MEQKLLVVALGTTGGEVGLAFKQQVARRTATARNFYYKMLCLDTSDQLRKSGRVAPSEFVHLATEEHYMNTIVANSQKAAPKLHEMLYPDFPPPPSTANGAGNIRYSASALLALPSLQESIRGNLRTLIGQLADMGETKSRDISFVIVISAVGATGSGSLSLLIPLVLETAQNATITKPNIDIVILHPVLGVSERLLLANAEALYIELAAHDPDHDSYTGRKLVLGSGHTITRLEELERTAATLIRLTTDARYGITEPYWSALPNRGILREQEMQTMLPTHLSSATPVTIGLANLSKQVVEVDTVRLVKRLIGDAPGQDETRQHVNTLLSHLSWLQGSDPAASYRLLLDNLTAAIRNRLDSYSLSAANLTRFNNAQKADLIRSQYYRDLDLIEQEKAKIRPQAQNTFKKLREELNEERIRYMKSDIPLTQLRKDYEELRDRIKDMQAAASRVDVSPPWSDEQLQHMWHDVAARGKPQAINSAVAALQQNLVSKCEAAAVQTATMFLNSLRGECLDVIQRIQAFIHDATERFKNKPGWDSNAATLQVQNDHPLYISALSSKNDVAQYYNHVGIFAQRDMQHDLFSEGDGAPSDPLALFRHELEQQDLVKHFFDGNYTRIFTAIEQYVEDRVRKQLEDYPLMKVFESMRPVVLRDCLSQALDHAQSLMPFSEGFASGSVEKCFVTACWSNEQQHTMLQEALSQISQEATLLKSDDPTEIVVFYLIDGLAMAAIMELTGRCLKNFLDQRSQWTRHNSNLASRGGRRGIPVYSGYNLEMQVRQQGIVHRLYNAKQHSVGDYTPDQVPELADPNDADQPQNESGKPIA